MSECLKHSTALGCWNKADTTKQSVVIHYTYGVNSSGVEIIKATRYTTSDGTPIILGVGDIVTVGECIYNEIAGSGFGCINGEVAGQTVAIDSITNDTLVADIFVNGGDYTITFPLNSTSTIATSLIHLTSGATGYTTWELVDILYGDAIATEESLGIPTGAIVGSNYVITIPASVITGSPTVGVQSYTFSALNIGTPTTYQLPTETIKAQVQWVKTKDINGDFYDRYYTLSPSGDPLVEFIFDPTTMTFTEGNCVKCKKEIFAVHDRFISVPTTPAGAVAYEMTSDLPTQGLDVSNAYFHLIYPTVNGSQNIAYGPQLTEYFANPQLGILWSDIVGVQAVIDFVLPLMGLNIGDVVYAINTSNTPIFFLSPTAVAELANGTYLHIYWGDSDVHSSYNEKADVNIIAANPEVLLGGANKCVGIQEIKEKDTCTGEETYRYVIEDLNGVLVPVTDIYPDFVESDVLLECPEAVIPNKIPVTQRVYQSAVGAITVPANARREALVFNRSNRDILFTWTGTLGGGGTFTAPARGTYSLTLIENPNEGLFATMVTSSDLYGTGTLGANELLIDFKN